MAAYFIVAYFDKTRFIKAILTEGVIIAYFFLAENSF